METYLLATLYFPADKTTAVAEHAIKLAKFPWDKYKYQAKPVFTNAIKMTKKGIVAMTMQEVDSANLGGAYRAEQDYLAKYHDIVGFTYKIEVWNTMQEAMDAVGVKIPA